MNNTEQNIVEVVARALAISIYHSEGLETMNYSGEQDYANREWQHYECQAKAVLSAIRDMPLKEEGILAAEKAYRHMLETRPMPHAIRAYINTLLGEVK